MVRITTQDKIPSTDKELDDKHRNSQQKIVEAIHKRFPYVTDAQITTQMGNAAFQKVNGFEEKIVIVPPQAPVDMPAESENKFVQVQLTDYTITIIDNGQAMEAKSILRMFVPKYGTKETRLLSGKLAQDELKKVKVVQDKSLAQRISFSRNGEVVETVDIPEDIVQEATVKDGLMVEFGSLLDVPESRDWLSIPLSLKEGEVSNFKLAIDYCLKQIIHHPKLSSVDKLRYLNTIIVGLTGLAQGNPGYEHIITGIIIGINIQKLLAPLLAELKEQGFLFLPHLKQFSQLNLPKGKEAFFLHPGLFEWGAVSLKEMGVEIVPGGITWGGEKRLPLVVAPFKPESLSNISLFNRLWHRLKREEYLPLIKTDRFIAIPQELGARFLELTAKRNRQRLSKKEEKKFASFLQRINILTAEEVVTSYEITQPKENIILAPQAEFAKEEGKIDSTAVNNFLAKPPVLPQITPGPTTIQVPSDANQRYIVLENGDLVEVESGKIVLSGILNMEYIRNGYYRIKRHRKESIDIVQDRVLEEITKSWQGKDKLEDTIIDEIIRLSEGPDYNVRLSVSNTAGQILFSPDKRFAYVESDVNSWYEMFDLDTGERFYLWGKGFSNERIEAEIGVIYSSLQFSRNGKYVTYIQEKLKFSSTISKEGKEEVAAILELPSEKTLFIVGINSPEEIEIERKKVRDGLQDQFWGIEGGKIIGHFNLGNRDVEYSINPFANVAFVWDIGTGLLSLIDLEKGEVIEDVKYLHTDSTGTYTIIIDTDGEMFIYIHKTKKMLLADDLGDGDKKITSVLTKWKDGQAFYEVMLEGGWAYRFDENGQVISKPELIEQDYFEEFLADGAMRVFSNIAGKTEELRGVHLVSPFAVDPLQRLDQPGAYKHPHFDLFIDNSDPDNPVAIEPKTGERLPFKGEIISYSPQRRVLVSYYEGYLYETSGAINLSEASSPISNSPIQNRLRARKVAKACIDSIPANFIVVEGMTETWQHIDYQTSTLKDLHISLIYTSFSFDGKYFVFVNPKTGDVAYLDPEKPDAPIFVSAQPSQPQVTLTDQKPQDAPNRFVIKQDAGGYFIFDAEREKIKGVLNTPVWRAKRIERINKTTFILYGESDTFHIFGYYEQGLKKFELRGDKEEKMLFYNDRFVVIEQVLNDVRHRFLFDTETGEYRPPAPAGYQEEISLSSSGRFSIHKDGRGNLVYYDHDETMPTPKLINNAASFKEYLVHQNADVVITKDVNDKYELFSLPLSKKLVFDAEHIEIDSSGMIAVVKKEDWLDYFNLKISQDFVHYAHGNIKIATDDKYIYIISKVGTIGPAESIHILSKEDGFMRIIKDLKDFIKDPGNFTLPRFWESYDLEKKTIWDRQTGENMSGSEIEYQDKSPTDSLPDKDIKLLGEMGVLWSKRDDWLVKMGNLESDKPRDWSGYYHINFKEYKFDSLQGGKVVYGVNKNGRDYLVGKSKRLFRTVAFVNQSKTFMLAGESYPHLRLINSDGEEIGIADQIPSGFIPTDVNGDYFVLSNPQTGEVKYLDPRTVTPSRATQVTKPSPEDLKKQQEALGLWNEQILSKRDEFITQARTSYQPFLSLLPEEYSIEIEHSLKTSINELYEAQEEEIKKRYQAALESSSPLDLDNLPFDLFSSRMQQALAALSGYLDAVRPYLSQERYEVQRDYYADLFNGLFALSKDSNIMVEKMDETFFAVLAHGFNPNTQEQFNAIPLIAQLIADLRDATDNQIKIAEVRKIVVFLWQVTDLNPAQNTPVVKKQLEKILQTKPSVKRRFLTELYQYFSKIEQKQLIDYLKNPDKPHNLGEARSFAVFLSQEVEMLVEKEQFIPQGIDIALPAEDVEISQIWQMEQQRPKQKEDDVVMDIEYLLEHIHSPPKRSDTLEAELLRNITVQAPPGADKRELTQNSQDATKGKKGELVVSFYLQKNQEGKEEYVEEAVDNGTGALQEAALIIPKSTKAAGEQRELAGFFGTGKYTMFEGVDRLEIITKNQKRSFMFTFIVIKDESGRPKAVKLSGIRKVNDERIKQGVTVRRIKLTENTIPELDAMLSQRSWKTFTGLAQDENFRIYFLDQEGKRQALTVEKEVLSEVEFKAIKPEEEQETIFGTMRIISTKDMPLQLIDKAGLRVSELKEEYLSLIPAHLRNYIQELGIVIQIPLPLIRNRTAFEHENEYLSIIQKYVAIEFYKAIAYKTLTQTSPQFVFTGFSRDWETNDDYWDSIDLQDKTIVSLVEKINHGLYSEITEDELKSLLTEADKLDKEKRFVKLLLLVEVPTQKNKPQERTSLLLRRLAIQEEINRQRAETQAQRLKEIGFTVGKIPDVREVPYYAKKIFQAQVIETGHDQIRNAERYIIDPKEYSSQEQELVELAFSIAKHFGLEEVLLVSDKVRFAGAFRQFKGKQTMLLNRSVAHHIGQPNPQMQILDEATDTVVHELAHLLEELMRLDDVSKLWEQGYLAHPADFTHDPVGTFAEAMKYVSAVSLASHGASSPTINSNDFLDKRTRELNITQRFMAYAQEIAASKNVFFALPENANIDEGLFFPPSFIIEKFNGDEDKFNQFIPSMNNLISQIQQYLTELRILGEKTGKLIPQIDRIIIINDKDKNDVMAGRYKAGDRIFNDLVINMARLFDSSTGLLLATQQTLTPSIIAHELGHIILESLRLTSEGKVEFKSKFLNEIGISFSNYKFDSPIVVELLEKALKELFGFWFAQNLLRGTRYEADYKQQLNKCLEGEHATLPMMVSLLVIAERGISMDDAVILQFKQRIYNQFNQIQLFNELYNDFVKFYNSLQFAASPLNPINTYEVEKAPGGIDLSTIDLTLKDEKFISSLNPADRQILLAAKYCKDGWESLTLLYIHQIMLMLKDNLIKDIQNRDLLFGILNQLKLKDFLDPQALQFLNFLHSQKPLSEIKLSLAN